MLNSGMPYSIALHNEYLFIGNSDGVIRIFDKQQRNLGCFGGDKSGSEFKDNAVTCIDVHKSGLYICSGFKKG